MSKISNDGAEQLKTVRNALDSIYSKLDSKTYNKVKEEFAGIAEILANVQDWEKV
jgi:uncharacterized protein (UPF0297 family)